MYFWHALPPLWWELSYDDFLLERRIRKARVIKAAWEHLSGKTAPTTPIQIDLAAVIAAGEGDEVEFKSTLRTNLHTNQVDEKMHLAVLKTIAGFLNAKGGALLIGVADSGEVLGLDADGFPNEDKMGLHLVNLVKDRIGDLFLPYIHYRFEEQDGRRTLLIRCEKGPRLCGNAVVVSSNWVEPDLPGDHLLPDARSLPTLPLGASDVLCTGGCGL